VDLLSVAVEFYRLVPSEFTAARNAHAKEIQASGNRSLAAQVRQLPKASASAWALNQFAHSELQALSDFAALGTDLRAAQQRADREQLDRHLQQRKGLIRQLLQAVHINAAKEDVRLSPTAGRDNAGHGHRCQPPSDPGIEYGPPLHDGGMDDPTQGAAELRRTMYIAALWFAAALLSGTITTAMLIASGWRPYRLAAFPGAIWIVGTSAAALGTVLLAWAGCPITKESVAEEDRRKSLVVRIGIAAFIVGTAAASVVELSSPVHLG
jgi:hypothetical protein